MLMLTNASDDINLWGLGILQTFSVASEMLSNFGYVWKLGKVCGSQLITFGHVPQTVTVFGPFQAAVIAFVAQKMKEFLD